MNLLVLGGIGTIAYLLFADKAKQLFRFFDVNTFGIVGIKNINFKSFPTLKFDVISEYTNQTDITIPISNIVVKVYKVTTIDTGEIEEEISNSNPNTGVELIARETTKFTVPMSLNLKEAGFSLIDIISGKKPKLRVRVWITTQNQTFEDTTDFSL